MLSEQFPIHGVAHELVRHWILLPHRQPTRLALDAAAMSFHVGQKVCCIARSIHPKADVHPNLFIGKIYTVTDVIMMSGWRTPGLFLAEIAPRCGYIAFESLLFRPIVSRKTDIAIFKRMLLPQGEDA